MQDKIASAKKEIEKLISERREMETSLANLKERIANFSNIDNAVPQNSSKEKELEEKICVLEKKLVEEIEEKTLFEDVNKGIATC